MHNRWHIAGDLNSDVISDLRSFNMECQVPYDDKGADNMDGMKE